MIGKKLFSIEDRDIVRGISTSRGVPDGGFSPETDAANLVNSPGVVYQPASPTDKSTNLIDLMIASCGNGNTAATADRFFLAADDSTKDGTYYYWDGTNLILKRTDSTNNYIQGKSFIEVYKSELYATSDTTVIRWVPDSVFNVTFYDFTGSYGGAVNVPHPILVFEDNIFYGNGNVLLRQTAAAGAPAAILTLSVEQVIVALGIDPGSGKMLISTVNGFNISDTLAQINKVHYYDGFSNKTAKTVQVDDMITAFYSNGGNMYVGYGQSLGTWNGAGISFLRHLNVAFDNTELPYKSKFTNIGSTLYVVEKTKILAFGPIQEGGEKHFYYAYKNNVNSNNISHICNIGQNKLGIGFPTDKFYTFDTMSIATTNTQDFFTNEYDFDRYYWIRWILIVWDTAVSNNADPGSLRIYSEEGQIQTGGSSGLYDLANISGASSYVKKIEFPNLKMVTCQLELILDTVNAGVKRIIVFGEPADLP